MSSPTRCVRTLAYRFALKPAEVVKRRHNENERTAASLDAVHSGRPVRQLREQVEVEAAAVLQRERRVEVQVQPARRKRGLCTRPRTGRW